MATKPSDQSIILLLTMSFYLFSYLFFFEHSQTVHIVNSSKDTNNVVLAHKNMVRMLEGGGATCALGSARACHVTEAKLFDVDVRLKQHRIPFTTTISCDYNVPLRCCVGKLPIQSIGEIVL